MKTRPLSRRTVLRGLLGGAAVSVGLPWLEIFGPQARSAFAAPAEGFPKRFALFFWGNGMLPERWIPGSTGEAWPITEQLEPLRDVWNDVSVVTGLRVMTGNVIPHGSGPGGFLSGAPLLVNGDQHTFAAPSIDQVIANAIGNDTRFRSIEFGAEPDGGLSYNGPNSRNPPESSPFALFERVFGVGFRLPGETTEVDPTIGLRRSVLDAVMTQTSRLEARLGSSDRARLDQHLTGIRDLERRLARLEEDPPQLDACARAEEPLADYPDLDGRPQLAEKNRAMCDIAAMALACDQTRVISNFLTSPVNNLLFEGASAGHHQLTHDEPGEQPQVNAITIRLMHEFAYMVEALRAVPEGEGTLLDSMLVLGTSDVSFARTHSIDEYPVLLGGTAGGYFKRNFHYRSGTGENASTLLLSILRSMGIEREEFGAEGGRVASSLAGIEA